MTIYEIFTTDISIFNGVEYPKFVAYVLKETDCKILIIDISQDKNQ